VCGWQVKLCDPLVTHGPYLSALAMVLPHNKTLYKSPDYRLHQITGALELRLSGATVDLHDDDDVNAIS